MTTDDAVEQLLDRLGSSAGPAIDPQFADRLDAALRETHVARTSRHERSVWVPVAAALAGVAALVVGVLLAAAIFTAGDLSGAVLTAADDTTIVEPGEAASPGRPGQRLPDGTRIIVGPSGEAVVDGVVLGPGAEAVITDGRLEVVVPTGSDPPTGAPSTGRPASEPGGSTAPVDARPATDRDPVTDRNPGDDGPGDGDGVDGPGDSDRPTTPPPTGSTTTVRDPSTSRTDAPSTTRGESSTTTATAPERTRSSSTQPDTTPANPPTTDASAPTTRPGAPTLDLATAIVPPGRVRLDWVIEGLGSEGATLAGFRLEADDGERISTVVLIRSPSTRTATIERLPVDVSFRVHAIDDRGRVVASSPAVPQPPP